MQVRDMQGCSLVSLAGGAAGLRVARWYNVHLYFDVAWAGWLSLAAENCRGKRHIASSSPGALRLPPRTTRPAVLMSPVPASFRSNF